MRIVKSSRIPDVNLKKKDIFSALLDVDFGRDMRKKEEEETQNDFGSVPS